MATYKGIKGIKVVTKTSDPTASEADATVWYNSTGNALKYAIQGAAAWASGTNTSRTGTTDAQLSGTQTAALYAGGYAPAPTLNRGETEKYDGTTWTEVADLNTARYASWMGGTQTASVYAGGQITAPSALSETWDGTSWTETNNMQNSRHNMGMAGTQTNGLAIGGLDTTPTGDCEDYDGTCWTTGTAINTARYSGGSAGASSTSAIFAGGANNPPPSAYYNAISETWNGSSWTEGNNLNTARFALAGFGIVTAALVCAGYLPAGSPRDANNTETYNGTSWAVAPTMGTARYSPGGTGGPGGISSGLIAGGNGDSGLSQAVEEWNDPVYTIKTVTVS